jgi:hypothetical protein
VVLKHVPGLDVLKDAAGSARRKTSKTRAPGQQPTYDLKGT